MLAAEAQAEHVLSLKDEGFKAVKVRLHRIDPEEDLQMVEAVRKAVGPDLKILVDANQNNASDGYPFWSRKTALHVAIERDALGVHYTEDPLPRTDTEGPADLAASVEMHLFGGEHTPTYYDFREHILQGAYDIIQPDVVLGGN